MTVWLLQSICENKHCQIAAIYDDTVPNSEVDARQLIAGRTIPEWACSHCGSSHFSLIQGRTIFRSTREGAPIMGDPMTKAAQPVDLLAYLNERCCKLFCGKNYHGPCSHELCPRPPVPAEIESLIKTYGDRAYELGMEVAQHGSRWTQAEAERARDELRQALARPLRQAIVALVEAVPIASRRA